jgi:hypothetical protein
VEIERLTLELGKKEQEIANLIQNNNKKQVKQSYIIDVNIIIIK